MRYLAVLALAIGCSKTVTSKPPSPSTDKEKLSALYASKLKEAESLRDPETGWLARFDCDGMIWAARYAASDGVSGVNILAAEYPDAPGKFSRRPFPACWIPGAPDPQGSATTWSRDMAIAGLLPWIWETKSLAVLQRHADYVHSHKWWAGEPVADGRAYYSPSMIGVIYKEIAALGGPADPLALWPQIWPSGLVDYQAHLQASAIWLQGEIEGGSVSQVMIDRMREHVDEAPADPWYSYIMGKYTGDQTTTIALLLDPTMPMGHYVRCNSMAECRLAQWLWTASHMLRDLK